MPMIRGNMTIYFLRDKLTGDYYVRRNKWTKGPVGAATWTTPEGPRAAKGAITLANKGASYVNRATKFRDPEAVSVECPMPREAE